MKMKEFPNGLTVRELKEVLADWPDTDDAGNELEVWFENERTSNSEQVNEIWPLNISAGGADLLLVKR